MVSARKIQLSNDCLKYITLLYSIWIKGNEILFIVCDVSQAFDKVFHDSGLILKWIQVGKDQKKVQSEKDSHSKNRGEKKTLTIRYLYHETYRLPNEQLFSQ